MQPQGMFDITPGMVGLQQDQEGMQQAMSMAQMGPANATLGFALDSYGRAGRFAKEAFGVQDPRKEQAMKVQEALQEVRSSGVDFNSDPEAFYKAMAKAFSSRGLEQQAMQALEKAYDYADKAETRKLKSELGKNSVEKSRYDLLEAEFKYKQAMEKAKNRPGFDNFLSVLKAYPEANLDIEGMTKAITTFADTGDTKLALSHLKAKKSDDKEKLIGTTSDSGVPVFTAQGEGNYIKGPDGSKVPFSGAIKTVGGTTVDLRNEGAVDEQYNIQMKEGYKRFVDEKTAAEKLTIPLATMRRVLDSGKLTTGTAAEQRTELSRLGATLGFTVDDKKLQNDDVFDAMVTEVMLPRMQQLGGNDSVEEMKQILKATGNRKYTIDTLGQILGVAERAVAKTVEKEKAYNEFLANGGRPNRWDFIRGVPLGQAAKAAPKETKTEYVPSQSEIDKYKAQVKAVTGKDLPDSVAIQKLKQYRDRNK